MKTEIIIGKHAHVTCKNESPPEKGGISESSKKKTRPPQTTRDFISIQM